MRESRAGAPTWLDANLVSELNGHLWHATNEKAFEQIVQDGFVRVPAQAKYANGFCRGIGAVSLFDLGCLDPPPYNSHWSQWISDDPQVASYWLEVDRELARASILDPKKLLDRWKVEQRSDAIRIMAGIESAHIGPLPLSNVRRVVRINHPKWTVISLP